MRSRTYPATSNELGDSDDEAIIRGVARQIAEKCDARVGNTEHLDCWQAWTDVGFGSLRHGDGKGQPLAETSAALITIEETARCLCGAPYVAGGMLAPELLRLCGADADQVDDILESQPVGVVLDPTLSGMARDPGSSAIAWDTGLADRALMLQGEGLAFVELGDPLHLAGDTRVTRRLAGTPRPIGIRASRRDVIARFDSFARLIVTADLLGAAGSILDEAVNYAKDRVQFGVPIASFQAVQHLCAAALVRLEATRSSMLYSAWVLDRADLTVADEASRVTKAYAAAAAIEIVHNSIQVLGGIAITWEHPAHRHLRRVLLDRLVFGDEVHLQRALVQLEERSADGLR